MVSRGLLVEWFLDFWCRMYFRTQSGKEVEHDEDGDGEKVS